MAVGRTNAAAKGGGGIDYNTKPQITFDGKWSNWYIEFYAGVPYWEAQFYSSGTLSVTGSYTADAHGIGGGGGSYNYENPNAGDRGATSIKLNLTLTKSVAVTIGAGAAAATGGNGGTTKLGSVLSCAGGAGLAGINRPSSSRGDELRRFGDHDHSTDIGDDGSSGRTDNFNGAGGMMHWKDVPQSGEGYGAGGGVADLSNYNRYHLGGHSGALFIRIAV